MATGAGIWRVALAMGLIFGIQMAANAADATSDSGTDADAATRKNLADVAKRLEEMEKKWQSERGSVESRAQARRAALDAEENVGRDKNSRTRTSSSGTVVYASATPTDGPTVIVAQPTQIGGVTSASSSTSSSYGSYSSSSSMSNSSVSVGGR